MATRYRPIPEVQKTERSPGVNANRGKQLSRKKDNVKDYSIGLMDVDGAIMYYFNEVIKPTIEDNGEVAKVPVLYSNAERWKTAQVDGVIRDNRKQVILPVITFKRTSIAKDESIPVDKLGDKDPQLFYHFERLYNAENRYDKYSVQQGLTPARQYHSIAMPDYMTMTYDAIIWTSYTEHMNEIIEKINFSEGSYWGEPGKFKFRVAIDSFDDATELADRERIVRSSFSFSCRGYLMPDSINKAISTRKYFTPKEITLTEVVE
jgi:hypothetical protein